MTKTEKAAVARVREFVDPKLEWPDSYEVWCGGMFAVSLGDLRAVLALAEKAGELLEQRGESEWNAAIECCITTMRQFGGIDGGTEKLLRGLLSNRAALAPRRGRAGR